VQESKQHLVDDDTIHDVDGGCEVSTRWS